MSSGDDNGLEHNDALVPEPTSAGTALRRGWTTGTCAAAAARAAYEALVSGTCLDMVEVVLPGGGRASFATAMCESDGVFGRAGVVKDAGDDPDVTHGALIVASVTKGQIGSGIIFKAGEGVGTVTKPGLPISPGEPAINPVPREMIGNSIREVSRRYGAGEDVVVEISIPGGEEIAKKTLNGRLGILGGLSILGTTGIVIPYSCAAWIHSIHRGVDVARALGLTHIAGSTGSRSENSVKAFYNLPNEALIDMGDFVGGMLKYVRTHPVARVTITGGFAKMTKLGQGMLDLHSKRGSVDFQWLAERVALAGAPAELIASVRTANTAQLVLEYAKAHGIALGDLVAEAAWQTAAKALRQTDISLDVLVFDRNGKLVGRSETKSVQTGLPR